MSLTIVAARLRALCGNGKYCICIGGRQKKRPRVIADSESPLGGDCLRRPMSLTIVAARLRALCSNGKYCICIGGKQKKRPRVIADSESPLGGDYLLSHFRSTIGVVRLNFSVRNGKRWDPHAIITSVSFWPHPFSRKREGKPVMSRGHRGNAPTLSQETKGHKTADSYTRHA